MYSSSFNNRTIVNHTRIKYYIKHFSIHFKLYEIKVLLIIVEESTDLKRGPEDIYYLNGYL